MNIYNQTKLPLCAVSERDNQQQHWIEMLALPRHNTPSHYNNVIMSAMASQITSLTIVYSTVYSGADQRNYQSSAPPTFVRGVRWWPVNSPHKGPVTRKMFSFDGVIMKPLSGLRRQVCRYYPCCLNSGCCSTKNVFNKICRLGY